MTNKPAGQSTFEPALPWFRGSATLSLVYESYLVPLALLALFGWFLFSVAATVERILHYYNALPYWDYWRIAQNLSQYHAFHLAIFWKQHNDHRIVFPEIIFALDMLVLHGRIILPLAVSFVSYLATWLLLSSTLFADRKLNRPVAIAATLLAGVIALWQGSAVLLASPFQLQWTLMQLAVSCSLIWLSKLKETSKSVYLAGAIAAAVVANYTSGNGLLLWPLLLALGFAIRLDRRRLLVLAIASVLFVGLYFVGYQFGSDLNLSNLLSHPWHLFGYVCTYLSMPFGGIESPEFGIWTGFANLFITLALFLLALRRGLCQSRPGLVLFGSYAFTLLTILLTAAGRMDPLDVTFSAAKPQRYVTVPLMNWAVFILLSLWVSARSRFKTWLPPLLACLVSLLLLMYLPKLRVWLANITEDFAEQQLAALAMENDVFDSNLLHKIFISPEFIMQYVPALREQHLSIYYKGHDRWLGKPLFQFSHDSGAQIPGQITSTFPVYRGVEVVGWADSSAIGRAYTWVVLANEHAQIVGFGRRLGAGFPSILVSDTTPPSLSWAAFVNWSIPAQSISAYAVDSRRGGLFRIAGSTPLPALRRSTLDETAGVIPGLTWQKDPIWTENTLPARVEFGEIPPGVNYGSWSGNDANRGQIVSSIFATPVNGCVILPVLHGPKSGGLSAQLIDADTAQAIAAAPIQDGDTRWEFWRIPIPTAVRHLRVLARDDGKDWGEWLAVNTPLTCR